MTDIQTRLRNLGVDIRTPAKPVANYVGYTVAGNLIFTAWQIPLIDGKFKRTGLLGDTVSLEEGIAAARQCAINVLAQIDEALQGDLSRIKQIVKITGFVACTREFADHPKVMNGASDFFVAVFGNAGKHARSAVGVSSLPLGAPVEVEAIAELH